MEGQTGSRLGRLFTYSKDALITAQENFTTEALRMAIEDDQEPMVEALYSLDPMWAGKLRLRHSHLRPSSQVPLPRGWLDLAIEVRGDEGSLRAEVWVEVKIGAKESKDQLAYYWQQALLRPRPIWLLSLGPEPLRSDVQNLTWNDLYLRARHGRRDHRSWRQHRKWEDLGKFLEEQKVANDALSPLSDAEAGSLEPAYQLIAKVIEVVKGVNAKVPSIFSPELSAKVKWGSEGALLNYVGINFRTRGEMGGLTGPLWYGLISDEGTAFWMVEVDPTRQNASRDEVNRVREAVDAAASSLGAPWTPAGSGTSMISARTRAAGVPTREAAVMWLVDRLRDLAPTRIVEAYFSATPPSAQHSQDGGPQ